MKPPAPVTSARVGGIPGHYNHRLAFSVAAFLLALAAAGALTVSSIGPHIPRGLHNSVVTLRAGDRVTQTLAPNGRAVSIAAFNFGEVRGDGLLTLQVEALNAVGDVQVQRTRRVRLTYLTAHARNRFEVGALPPASELRLTLTLTPVGPDAAVELHATEGHTYAAGALTMNGQPQPLDLVVDARYSAIDIWPAAATALQGVGWGALIGLAVTYGCLLAAVIVGVALAAQRER
jgi:hypothetical protein